ncbi:low temperature requirement protein A [Phormidium sp. CLA17]|uniref:low temperature requirement protein A n=1 Tax=Leptolyngbya sp. Cla-17 TaxID=2803751 RepID=UPI0014924E86|nr:low temperature requirement protein A [Leptolyngbya sp. Cla-17]MBM0742828.1 low temperature requirement protein A [Leptolyngbya sp. Cla-17]
MTSWIQPPRLRGGEEDETRRVTWLELFYDLVFVVAVSQVAHNLSKDVSLTGFVGFVALFVPLWWAWIGTTLYANRFDTDTVIRRLLMGVQMLAIAALAINVHHGLDDSSSGFALSYAMARIVLVLEYLWAGWCIPSARGLTTHYSIGFAIAAIFWIISALVPLPLRFAFWAVGLAVDFATPLTAQRHQANVPPHLEHLPERFGLFTIIVLGEAIIAVVRGVSEMKWSSISAFSAVCGFIVAFGLWWIYFDNVDGSAIRAQKASGRLRVFQFWFYSHLPLVIGLAATGIGVEHVILTKDGAFLTDPERWLICGSVALCFLSLAVLHRTGIIFKCKARTKHRLSAAGILFIVAIAGANLPPVVIIAITATVCAIEVGLDLYQGRSVTTPQSI